MRATTWAAPADAIDAPSPRALLARRALGAALAMGVAGDLLLRGGGLGINALLLAIAGVAMVRRLDASRGDDAAEAPLVLYLVPLLAGLAITWRASETIAVGGLLLTTVAVALLADALRTGAAWSLWQLDPLAPVAAWVRAAHAAVTGDGANVARDARDVLVSGRAPVRGALAGWRGALLALPLLLVFNALFMSADPVYARLLARLDVDLSSLLGHVMATLAITWLVGGWARRAFLSAPPAERTPEQAFDEAVHGVKPARNWSMQAADVLVPLAIVDALFAGFLLVQARTAIGGAAYVRATAGLTIAEWARGGFFELLFVAALAIPALLAADALAPLDHRTRARVRVLGGTMLALLLGILGSAAARMLVYLDAFGLTEDRLFASAAMGWLAFVIVWCGVTVLRERRQRFAGGALAAAWATWAALVVASPDAVIVRTNLARLETGRPFDIGYVTQLGPEAVPHVARALPRLGAIDACRARGWMAHHRAARQHRDVDWRSWTYGSWRADAAAARAGVSADAPVTPCGPRDVVAPRVAPAGVVPAAPVVPLAPAPAAP